MSSQPLPHSVEQLLDRIATEKAIAPADPAARRELARIGEESALDLLRIVERANIRTTVSAFIMYLARSPEPRTPEKRMAVRRTPERMLPAGSATSATITPIRDDLSTISSISELRHDEAPPPPRLPASPILEALGELEFRKAFMILSYIGNNNLDDMITYQSIMKLKLLPMALFERELWNIVRDKKCISKPERRENIDWDSRHTYMYHCHVDPKGKFIFKGPYLEDASTHLHRMLGDDNILMVKFAAEGDYYEYKYMYHKIAEEGIPLGLRRYRFFVYKDGGKEGSKEKKSSTSSSVKCYFVRTESTWAMDERKEYLLCNKSIQEARSMFMHVNTIPNMAKYMARFSLVLSKTIPLDIDMSSVKVEIIDDISCKDENGQNVYGIDSELMIHTDGTGFISEDLAMRCPRRVWKGREPRDSEELLNGSGGHYNLKQSSSLIDVPPLLIQCRLFHNGYAVKGTLLVNKELLPGTIHVRPSMIKVEPDPDILPIPYCNSLEVVGTSNMSKKTYLSKSVIALLHYGGVPKEYFLELAENAICSARDARLSRKSAFDVARLHGNMDDFLTLRMILCGIPLDEPFLQSQLLVMMREEFNNLKMGKIPIDDCYYLMGTADPTGKLQENEVCIILDKGQMSGDVLVYKHPGLHFGDVHALRAVYVQEIEKIVGNAKFAIFFPTRGPRSLADEMANSDYDGDLYWVSRNPQLLRSFKASKPWNWIRPKPKKSSQPKPSDLSSENLERQLFKNFFKNRFDPSFAMSEASDCWMTFMDRLLTSTVPPEEIQCLRRKILELIDIYYHALDASKAGDKVKVPKELKSEKYPHFLERTKAPSYHSSSILGSLYDMVGSFQNQDRGLEEVRPLPCLTEQPPQNFLDHWTHQFKEYRDDMSRALGNKDDKMRNIAAEEVFKKYKMILYGAEEFDKSMKNQAVIFDEALAIYHVVYNHINSQMEKKGSSCVFAWKVAGHALCALYGRKRGEDTFFPCSKSALEEIFGR